MNTKNFEEKRETFFLYKHCLSLCVTVTSSLLHSDMKKIYRRKNNMKQEEGLSEPTFDPTCIVREGSTVVSG